MLGGSAKLNLAAFLWEKARSFQELNPLTFPDAEATSCRFKPSVNLQGFHQGDALRPFSTDQTFGGAKMVCGDWTNHQTMEPMEQLIAAMDCTYGHMLHRDAKPKWSTGVVLCSSDHACCMVNFTQ